MADEQSMQNYLSECELISTPYFIIHLHSLSLKHDIIYNCKFSRDPISLL
jgi:hypothetical protein